MRVFFILKIDKKKITYRCILAHVVSVMKILRLRCVTKGAVSVCHKFYLC